MAHEFHDQVKVWSRIKHEILQRYLKLFTSKLAGSARMKGESIFYVDGFAGQGIYEDGREGSAYLAAKFAGSALGSNSGVLKCINVEADNDTFLNLEKHTEKFKCTGTVQNINAEFDSALEEVLRRTEKCTTFFFVDPFGMKGIESPVLERISKRVGKTEVLLRFDDTCIQRMLGNIKGLELRGDTKSKRAAHSLRANLRKMGLEHVLDHFMNSHELNKVSRNDLVEGYRELIVNDLQLFRFGLSYPITNPITDGHHYFLVHFCDFEDGYIHMANFMAWAERSCKANIQEELLPVDNQPEMAMFVDAYKECLENSNVTKITKKLPAILQQLKAKEPLQFRHVYAAIVDKFQWQFTRKEWEAAVKACSLIQPLDGKSLKDSSPLQIL